MQLTVKEISIALLSAVALFFLGQHFYPWFLEVAIPKVEGAYFTTTSFEPVFKASLKFSLIWAAAPVLVLLTWRLIPGLTPSKKIGSIILIFGGIISAILIKRFMLQQELNNLVVDLKNAPIRADAFKPLNEANYEYWMTVGLLAGTILCFILFRKKRNNGRNSKIPDQKI